MLHLLDYIAKLIKAGDEKQQAIELVVDSSKIAKKHKVTAIAYFHKQFQGDEL